MRVCVLGDGGGAHFRECSPLCSHGDGGCGCRAKHTPVCVCLCGAASCPCMRGGGARERGMCGRDAAGQSPPGGGSGSVRDIWAKRRARGDVRRDAGARERGRERVAASGGLNIWTRGGGGQRPDCMRKRDLSQLIGVPLCSICAGHPSRRGVCAACTVCRLGGWRKRETLRLRARTSISSAYLPTDAVPRPFPIRRGAIISGRQRRPRRRG